MLHAKYVLCFLFLAKCWTYFHKITKPYVILVMLFNFKLTWQMSKDSLVAIAADIEEAVDFGNVIPQTGRNHWRCEEVNFRPGYRLCCPELQQPRAIRRRRWGWRKLSAALHTQNALVKVSVVPHESRLEIVVVAMPMHSAQRRHTE